MHLLGFVPAPFRPSRRAVPRRVCASESEPDDEASIAVPPPEAARAVSVSSDSGKSRGKPRLTVDEGVMDKLTAKANSVDITPSRLANFIIDVYLGEIERVFFGRHGASEPVEVDPEERAVDLVVAEVAALCDCSKLRRVALLEALSVVGGHTVKLTDLEHEGIRDEATLVQLLEDNIDVEVSDSSDVVEKAYEIFAAKYATPERLFPYRGAKNLLERLVGLGIEVVLVSDLPAPELNAALGAMGLTDYSSHSTILDDNGDRLSGLGQIATEREVDASRCTLITDNALDVECGVRLGFRTIALAIDEKRQSLEDSGATVVREEPALVTLQDVIGGSFGDDEDTCFEDVMHQIYPDATKQMQKDEEDEDEEHPAPDGPSDDQSP